jgi:hypothetical protein
MRKSITAEVTLVENGDGSAYLEFNQRYVEGRGTKRRFASAALYDHATVSAIRSALVIMEARNAK